MKLKHFVFGILVTASFSAIASEDMISSEMSKAELAELDKIYSVYNAPMAADAENFKSSCMRETCPIYILVDVSDQRADIFVEGKHMRDGAFDKDGVQFLVGNGDGKGRWKVSTGVKGHSTPLFDRTLQTNPPRVYQRYSSTKYPGGDWQGYGNMPFAMFIKGGYAIHGTTGGDTWGNISKLGTVPLSHGCIRIHSENARRLNALVRKYGVANTWIRVVP
jgi:hypothetical protein